MPDATITSTASTFGTITGTFAADQSTVTGTITGTVAGTLTGSVGVPGPAGPGVPAGGTAGQYLQKIDGVDYNTDWVTINLSAYAPLNSPAFTGNPTAPTAALGDNDTSLATTAFVQQELASGVAVAKNLEVYVRNQSGSTIPAGSIVYISGATGNKPLITLAQANNDANSAQTMGFTKTAIANNGFGFVIVRGELENIDTSALTEGVQLYLSPTVAGTWTTTKPVAPQHMVYVGIVIRSHPTLGTILVAVQNGLELGELHDVKLTTPTNGQVLKYDSVQNLWVNDTDVGGVAWGGITGTLSSQTDLQTALDGKYSTSNPAGYITSSALTPYLTSATAASTYQTLAGMSSYLTTATAASTYAPIASPTFTGTVTIPGGASISGYLTTSSAASTYAALAGATFTGVVGFDGSSGIAAKSIGSFKSYASGLEATDYSQQFNTGFQVVASGTTVARLSASGLLLPSGGITFNDATTQSTAGISAATAAATYAPLASPALTGNPTAPTPATADDDTSIATTAFVKAQGYLTTAPVTSVAGKTGAVTLVVGDVSGAAALAGATFTGLVGTIASTTANAGLNVPHGVAPTTPVNGDIWTTTSGLFSRINGGTQQYAPLGSNNTFSNASSTFGSSTATGTISLASGATISGSTKTVNIGTAGVAGSTTNITAGPVLGASTITIGATTAASTLNLATGATLTATTKAVNIGTSGVAGSTTNIAIGSTTGTSTTTLQGITNGVTQSAGDSSLKLATTAFVTTADNLKADLASPALTGTPTAPTASTGTNTTQIATTAFVQTSNPDSSTTTKGHVELATVGEAQDGSSTSLVPTVEGVTWMMMNDAYRPYFNLTGGTSGTGAAINPVPPFRYEAATPTSGTGFAYLQTQNFHGMSDGRGSTIFDFSQKCWISFSLDNFSGTFIGDANNEMKVFWGLNSVQNGDDPNGMAIGAWKLGGSSSPWNLMVHDGTTLTKVASSTTMPTGQIQRFVVYSNGAGTVKLYINGTEVASTTAGPTGTRADTRFWASVKQTGTVGTRLLNMIFYPKVCAAP